MRIKFRNHELLKKNDKDFIAYAFPILQTGRFWETSNYIQHGTTSRYSHCIAVAYYSLKLADRFGISYDAESLITGALLHDYIFYDWHERDKSHMLHGFKHPKVALNNALQDFDLNPVEQNIIVRHMFPLTPIPPRYKESLIVCLTDKICSLAETFRINKTPLTNYPDVWENHKNAK